MKPKLILPDPSIQGKFAHAQDTFRELALMWRDLNLVDFYYSEMHSLPELTWEGRNFCLFDRPIFEEWSSGIPKESECVLYGNPAPTGNFQYESTWTFWARHPKQLEEARQNLLTYRERTIGTFFAGKIENPLQNQKRTQSKCNDIRQ